MASLGSTVGGTHLHPHFSVFTSGLFWPMNDITGLLTKRYRVGKKEREHPKHRGEGCHDNVATKWNRWSCGGSSIIAFCVMQVHLAHNPFHIR